MSEYGSYLGDMVSGCRIAGLTGAIVGRPLRVVSCLHFGPGVYIVTIQEPVDSNDCVVLATLTNGIASFIDATTLTDTTIGILTFDVAGAPADRNFQFAVFRTALGVA